MALSLTMKATNGVTIETSADPDLTIYDLKAICCEELNTVPEKQTLLFQGKVCDDEETLKSLNITNNSTLYVLLKKDHNPIQHLEEKKEEINNNNMNPMSMQQSPMQNPEFLKQIMDNPLMQQMFNNPDILQNMFNSSPALQKIMKQNPELRHALKDPALLKQIMKAATNKDYQNELRKNNDQALKKIESIPGGFSALSRHYKQMQAPMESAMDDIYQQRHGKAMTKITDIDTSNGPVNKPLENPWSTQYKQKQAQLQQQKRWNELRKNQQQPNNNMFNMMKMMNGMNNNQQNNNNQSRFMRNERFSQVYVGQLRELRARGFNDEQKNLNALIATGGNIEAAIQYLIDNNQTK